MEEQPIRFLLPVALKDVFDRLSPGFQAGTGHRFEAATMLNPEVPERIARGADWSIAASNPDYVARIVAAGGCDPVIRDLGRTPLAFAAMGDGRDMPATAADGIADVLRSARRIAVTGEGTSGVQFERLAAMLGLRDATEGKLLRLPGGGPMAALLAGEVGLAALPLTNVAPIAGVEAVAVCPDEMGVHIDLSFCLREGAGTATRAFADWLVDPDRDDEFTRLGLRRRAHTDEVPHR